MILSAPRIFGKNPIPYRIIKAHQRARIKNCGYHLVLEEKSSNKGNMNNIGTAIRM